MINFVTFGSGGANYENSKMRLLAEAKHFGVFDKITGYGHADLSPTFREKYADVLSLRKGGGYWIWKCDILEQEMSKIDENDFIVYADAGCTFNPHGKKRFFEYIQMLKDSPYGVFNFQLSTIPEYLYTNKSVFDHFNVDLNDTLAQTGMCIATVFILQKNEHSMKWLNTVINTLSENRHLFTDKYNAQQPQHARFIDHRHDQSICSIISKLQGSVVIRDETYDTGRKWGCDKSKDWPIWATRYR